jgi:hypothetical protein
LSDISGMSGMSGMSGVRGHVNEGLFSHISGRPR